MQIELPGFNEATVSDYTPLDAGIYVAQITVVETTTNNKGDLQLKVTMRIVNGPNQQKLNPKTNSNSPVGEEVWDYFAITEKAMFRVKQMCIAAKIISKDQQIPGNTLDTNMFVNKQVTIELYKEEYQGKQQTRVKYIMS